MPGSCVGELKPYEGAALDARMLAGASTMCPEAGMRRRGRQLVPEAEKLHPMSAGARWRWRKSPHLARAAGGEIVL